MAGQTCPLCQRAIAPGDNVAFQLGALVHLDCYAERLAQARSDTEDKPAT